MEEIKVLKVTNQKSDSLLRGLVKSYEVSEITVNVKIRRNTLGGFDVEECILLNPSSSYPSVEQDWYTTCESFAKKMLNRLLMGGKIG